MTSDPHQSLLLANRARLEISDVLHEIADGQLPIADAVYDPRARPIRLGRLLGAQHKWGHQRVHRELHALRDATWGPQVVDLNIAMRVRDLTERQRIELASWLRSR